jgi:hypothetical protein
MKKRLNHIAAYTVIAATLGFLALCIFWLVYPYQVPSVTVPITILNDSKQIRVGEPIELLLKVDKPNQLRPDQSVYITCSDGNLVTLASMPVNLPVGTYTVLNEKYILPPKVAVGAKCVFNFKNDYQVNPIRSISKHWYSEPFEVIK